MQMQMTFFVDDMQKNDKKTKQHAENRQNVLTRNRNNTA